MSIASSFAEMKLTPSQAMKMALEEAYKGAARVSPNPLVGAVVLAPEGSLLAKGFHEFFGGPHAEVNALKGVAPERLRGATLYVTLEPCAHEGKTPSCAKMLAKLPLKKVVYGLVDPNPLVAGQGAEILKQAGIETEVFSDTHPEMKEDLEDVCEAFLWNFRQKKVFVSLKIAQSLDGQIGLKTGESKWITNEKSREHAHYLRATHDATLVGRGTVESDNPSLNIRHRTIQKENKVVVLDPTGRLLKDPSSLALVQVHKADHVFWCVSEKAYQGPQVSFARILKIKESSGGQLLLPDLLASLWAEGIRSVLVEGGAQTASRFLNAGVINRLYLFQAPILLGAKAGRSWTESVEILDLKDKILVTRPKILTFDQDFLISGRLS